MTSASDSKRRDAAPDNTPGREHFIYAITFLPTNKRYIGRSINPKGRWHTHKSQLMTNKHWCRELQEDWNNNGKKAFSFTVIQRGIFSDKEAHSAELSHIFKSNCYNYLTSGGDENIEAVDLSKKRRSEALKRAWNNPDSNLRTPEKTRWNDPTQKQIQSEAMKKR